MTEGPNRWPTAKSLVHNLLDWTTREMSVSPARIQHRIPARKTQGEQILIVSYLALSKLFRLIERCVWYSILTRKSQTYSDAFLIDRVSFLIDKPVFIVFGVESSDLVYLK